MLWMTQRATSTWPCMVVWRGSAAGALVVVAPGGMGKSALAVGPGTNCSNWTLITRFKPSFLELALNG